MDFGGGYYFCLFNERLFNEIIRGSTFNENIWVSVSH